MNNPRLELLQEVSSCAENLLTASQDAQWASSKQMEIRQEISNTRNLINNLENLEKKAAENYELKRQIVNVHYKLFLAAKGRLDVAD